jgi:ABC-2 type transport system ATP-binding protein
MTAAPPGEVAVEVRGLTKRFGSVLAVDSLTFSVQPGRVTGFLGPNGAGKTTTLRMALGLVAPTAGTATIGGRPYADLTAPQRMVGAALEATGFHPGRTGRNHLRVLAATAGVDDRRVDQVLAMVGLADAAKRRTAGYSLGMRQRLGLAGALLADPRVLLLDEPANGLDPEGIAWLRGFLRHLAGQGRTVLVSGHVLSEVQQTVDDVVIIARGRLVRASTLADLEGAPAVVARSPRATALVDVLRSSGLAADLVRDPAGGDLVRVATADPAAVGHAAYGAGIELHELRAEASDLERIFLDLTGDAR